jgi:hypothetical protein
MQAAFFTLLFVAMFTLSLAGFAAERVGSTVLILMALFLWAPMSALAVYCLVKFTSRVTLEDEGLEYRSWTQRRRIRWADLREVDSTASRARLTLSDGRTLTIPFYSLRGGQELRRAIDARAPATAHGTRSEHRFQLRALPWFLIAVMAVVFGGGAAMSGGGQTEPLALLAVVLLALCPLAAYAYSKTIILTDDSFIERSVFGSRETPLSAVKSIRRSVRARNSTPIEGLFLRLGAREVYLSEGYTDFGLLRDRLLALCPKAVRDDEPGRVQAWQ